MLRVISRSGGAVGVCGTCMDARGIKEERLAEGCPRSTLAELTDWTLRVDKTLAFWGSTTVSRSVGEISLLERLTWLSMFLAVDDHTMFGCFSRNDNVCLTLRYSF
jgi:hypothetical protein